MGWVLLVMVLSKQRYGLKKVFFVLPWLRHSARGGCVVFGLQLHRSFYLFDLYPEPCTPNNIVFVFLL